MVTTSSTTSGPSGSTMTGDRRLVLCASTVRVRKQLRRSRWSLPVALGLCVLAGCDAVGAAFEDGEPIIEASAVADRPNAVSISFSGCDDDPPIRVVEQPDEVVITIGGPRQGCEPLFVRTLPLDAPLADRRIVDGTTNEVVPLGDIDAIDPAG